MTSCDLDFGTWQLNHLSVSEIGVTLLGSGKYDENQQPRVVINMNDGGVYQIGFITSFTSEERIYLKALADLPIDIQEIESIGINEDTIKLE